MLKNKQKHTKKHVIVILLLWFNWAGSSAPHVCSLQIPRATGKRIGGEKKVKTCGLR